MPLFRTCLLSAVWVCWVPQVDSADFEKEKSRQWHQWRGPHANGLAPQANPPIEWGPDLNIKWKTRLLGEGASTPIVWKNQVFVLAALETAKPADPPPVRHPEAMTEPPVHRYQFLVLCLDLETGQILWQRVAREEAPHEGKHQTHTYAAGSPTTDGERLYVSFGSRGVFAFTLEGQLLWATRLGTMRTRNGWGEASTPVVHRDSLFLVWDQEDDSYLFCLDAATGDVKWKMPRDEPTNWSTPFVAADAQPPQLIVNGTRRARGYNLANGEVLWECGELSVNAIPSPVVADGVAYCMSGYRKPVVYAIPLTARGDISGSNQTRWTYSRDTPYISSPLVHDGKLYMIKDRSPLLSILKTDKGEPIKEADRLPELTDIYASPILAKDRIYLVDRSGKTVVLRAGRTARVLAINDLRDQIDASPVAVGRLLLLRSWTTLYCIENTAPEDKPSLIEGVLP